MEKVYTEKEVLSGERNTKYYITGEEHPYLTICNYGNIFWQKEDKFHRTDGPAIIDEVGSKYHLLNGKEHRTDGPTCLCLNGRKYWGVNDKYHRTDGPAHIIKNGTQDWWIDGKITTQENIEKLQEKYFYKWKRKMIFKT